MRHAARNARDLDIGEGIDGFRGELIFICAMAKATVVSPAPCVNHSSGRKGHTVVVATADLDDTQALEVHDKLGNQLWLIITVAKNTVCTAPPSVHLTSSCWTKQCTKYQFWKGRTATPNHTYQSKQR
jgi:hypothetical protein